MTRETVGYGWNFSNFGLDSSAIGLGVTEPYRGENSKITQVTKPSYTVIVGDSKDSKTSPSASNNFEHKLLYTQSSDKIMSKSARRHNGGGNYLFFDGHVEWRTPEQLVMEPEIWKREK